MNKNITGYSSSVIQAIKKNYETFILNSADINHQGLYLKEGNVFALIHDLTEDEKKTILERYEKYRQIAIPPPIFCASIDKDAVRIDLSSILQKIYLHGEPFSFPEASNDLHIHLPKKYHPFFFDFKLATNVFELKLNFQPSEEECNELLGQPIPLPLDNMINKEV